MNQPHVFLLIGDCLRAADVSRETMSFTQQFADAQYRRCYAPSTWTLPSHASLYAQRTPIEHDVTRRGDHMHDSLARLPKNAKAAGYETALFSENPTFSGRTGFHYGIDNVHDFIDSKLFPSNFSPENYVEENRMKEIKPRTTLNVLVKLLSRPNRARNLANLLYSPLAYYQFSDTTYPHHGERIVSHLQSYLTSRKDQPLLSIVNFLDPHNPHHAPPEKAAESLGITIPKPKRKALWDASDNKRYLLEDASGPPTAALSYFDSWEEIFETRLTVYRAQIHHFDSLIRQWTEEIDEHLLRNSLVVITGDHGQLFGEEGMVGHHTSLHPRGIHVPLFVKYPESWPTGPSVVDESVSWLGLSRVLNGVFEGEIQDGTTFQDRLRIESRHNEYVVVTADGPTWNVSLLRNEYDNDRVDRLAVRKVGLINGKKMYVYESSWDDSEITSRAFDLQGDTRELIENPQLPELDEKYEQWLIANPQDEMTSKVSSRLKQLGYM